MKIALVRQFTSIRQWAFGFHIFNGHTLVVLIGTGWAWSLSYGPGKISGRFALGMCAGPLTVGFCA